MCLSLSRSLSLSLSLCACVLVSFYFALLFLDFFFFFFFFRAFFRLLSADETSSDEACYRWVGWSPFKGPEHFTRAPLHSPTEIYFRQQRYAHDPEPTQPGNHHRRQLTPALRLRQQPSLHCISLALTLRIPISTMASWPLIIR